MRGGVDDRDRMTLRRRDNSLEALSAHILNGYPAVALERRPRSVSNHVEAPARVVRVLDIQQMPLTRPNAQQVSVLICSEPDCPLALGLVGHVIGLRSYESESQEYFREQVIELGESSVYRQGRRRWFECPGVAGPCASKRMKLYLPPGESTFACADCHHLTIPHTPDRPLRWHDEVLSQEVLRWHEPAEFHLSKGA